jgi:peptidoglycan hydrolase CwlO-like protein
LDYTEKSYRATRELEKLSDDHTRVLNELDDLRNKLHAVQGEKDELQKELTKRVLII